MASCCEDVWFSVWLLDTSVEAWCDMVCMVGGLASKSIFMELRFILTRHCFYIAIPGILWLQYASWTSYTHCTYVATLYWFLDEMGLFLDDLGHLLLPPSLYIRSILAGYDGITSYSETITTWVTCCIVRFALDLLAIASALIRLIFRWFLGDIRSPGLFLDEFWLFLVQYPDWFLDETWF